MRSNPFRLARRAAHVSAAVAAAVLVCAPPAQARVSRIVIDQVLAQPAVGGAQTVPYQTINGRAFGELCIAGCAGAALNTIITDIGLIPPVPSSSPATPGALIVPYVASFSIVKPTNNSDISGILWHDVPNRGGRIVINVAERGLGDVGLSSGWQGDNAGGTAVPSYASNTSPQATGLANNEWVKTPVATGTTGFTLGRIINRTGTAAQPLNVMGNPIPYFPVDANDNSQATLTTHTKETVNGNVTVGSVIPNTDWKFCGGGTFDAPTPVTTLPVRVCLKSPGFDPSLLYQLVYQVRDPYVLGVGTAAFRDVGSFFRYAATDDFGTPNPIAGKISKAIIRGVSQSGNFTRHFIQLGMNQDEAGSIVHEGAWPIIAGRRVANNSRWGQPDGVLELYQQGSEGPQWWTPWPDTVRGLPTASIFDRCNSTTPNTCPKVIEHFGGSEVFALKMTTEWVGTSASADIPVPRNVRRYYVPSTAHGGPTYPAGGVGGFVWNPANNPTDATNFNPLGNLNCPGNNWGRGKFLANPVPETELVNVLRLALRKWVTTGTPPPPSRWPTVTGGTLVAPTQAAMAFPSGIPGIPNSIFLPENFVFPVFDYDWGPNFNQTDATGVPTNLPPPITHVIPMKVPKVDADGNELGGVPTVLRDAPLGTYLGWNITQNISGGAPPAIQDATPSFHAGQVCNYTGGFIPFAPDAASRAPNSGGPWAGDPRRSLAERYGTQAGYRAAVAAAAANAQAQGYLLAADAANLISQANAASLSLPLPP
jgi:hypothetical protein